MSHPQVVPSPPPVPAGQTLPDPEVVVKADWRRFTAAYKQRILQETDAATQPGAVGALLRREGLYSSHLSTWRHQRTQGELQGLTPAKRGRQSDPQAAEIVRLQRETERLTAQLARAELIIEVQKKSHSCLASPRARAARSNDRDDGTPRVYLGPGHGL